MSIFAYDNEYEDVFVFEDLVYAMERQHRVVHVYRNRNNSLIKLHDVRYYCGCSDTFPYHSIIVTKVYIIQCCAEDKLVSILDRSGELLREIPIAAISGHWPSLRQVDVMGNFLIADLITNRLIIAHADQPSPQWRVVKLPDLMDSGSCRGAVWFRHRLYVAGFGHRLLTFTPVE